MAVDCWFDYSSPFAYLGTTQIERVASAAASEVRFRPFLLGALFKVVGTPIVPLHSFSAPKRAHQEADLVRWATHWGVPYRMTSHFPLRTVTALRVTLLAGTPPALIHRIMRAAWVDDEDVNDADVLRRCLADVALDEALVGRARDAKEALHEATRDAIELGVPGAPTFIVGDELYWGQDRLHFVALALEGRPPR